MTLARACRDEVEAGFDHPSGREMRRRRVEPNRLVASDRRWHLLAYDLDRDDWRSFRVDRMADASARTWRFCPRAAPDAATYVMEGVASRVYPQQARFLVHASADTVRADSSVGGRRATARERALRGAQWRRQPRLRAHARTPAGARLRRTRRSGSRKALSRAGGETAVGRCNDLTGAGHGAVMSRDHAGAEERLCPEHLRFRPGYPRNVTARSLHIFGSARREAPWLAMDTTRSHCRSRHPQGGTWRRSVDARQPRQTPGSWPASS
jgi:WYL domain